MLSLNLEHAVGSILHKTKDDSEQDRGKTDGLKFVYVCYGSSMRPGNLTLFYYMFVPQLVSYLDYDAVIWFVVMVCVDYPVTSSVRSIVFR